MSSPRRFVDQLGTPIQLPQQVHRVISLVPSLTELLFDLDLQAQIAGVTKFCVHPSQGVSAKPKIGGTKKLHLWHIEELDPQLIIANKEENDQEQVEKLRQKFPLWVSDIKNLPQALTAILEIGTMLHRESKARNLMERIESSFQNLSSFKAVRALYLIWKKPFMAAGKDTFIHDMMKRAGFINVIETHRYPIVSPEEMRELAPEVVLLASEPFPFAEKHRQEINELLNGPRVMLVNGEMFSWYGSRLLQAPQYFQELRMLL